MNERWVDFRALKAHVSMHMLVEHYKLSLRKSGKELRGKCPIHKGEGTDTLHINVEKNVFQCFSCKAKGNVLDFVAAIEHTTVFDAARKVQEWFALPDLPTAGPANGGSYERLRPAQEKEVEESGRNEPLKFRLKGIAHNHPYLIKRGIDEATARKYGIGFFPGKGSMSGRVVIPIENQVGELVAYAGRSIDDSEPKYKFPAGFQKGQVLYNLHRVRETNWPDELDGLIVLVEGFFGCVRVSEAGFPCGALMGSSLSTIQERLISETFSDALVLLDGDEAGRSAALDVVGRLARSLFVRIVVLGEDKQPDDLSLAELIELLRKAGL